MKKKTTRGLQLHTQLNTACYVKIATDLNHHFIPNELIKIEDSELLGTN